LYNHRHSRTLSPVLCSSLFWRSQRPTQPWFWLSGYYDDILFEKPHDEDLSNRLVSRFFPHSGHMRWWFLQKLGAFLVSGYSFKKFLLICM
jgi:hypothetical protein